MALGQGTPPALVASVPIRRADEGDLDCPIRRSRIPLIAEAYRGNHATGAGEAIPPGTPQYVQHPVHLAVGGAIAPILPGLLSRRTEDIDVVDELPSKLRSQHQLLATLAARYGLGLTHFQSHYWPQGWQQRLQSQEPFGHLHVDLVDAYDVYLSKLFSARIKNRDDLRMLAPSSTRNLLSAIRRFRSTCHDLLAAPDLREKAEQNRYIIYGESLPT
jgi:hypothetical protein